MDAVSLSFQMMAANYPPHYPALSSSPSDSCLLPTYLNRPPKVDFANAFITLLAQMAFSLLGAKKAQDISSSVCPFKIHCDKRVSKIQTVK